VRDDDGRGDVHSLFHNQFRVPTYEDWVDNDADWSHVYAFHHQQLQHLQWHNRRDRWVLKTGAHMWGSSTCSAHIPMRASSSRIAIP